MTNRKIAKISLVSIWISSLLLLTSCWDYQELNKIGIVMGIGVDQAENGLYRFSYQLVNPSVIAREGGKNPSTPTTIYETTGKTQLEGVRKATQYTPRRMFFSHQQALIVSEEVARKGGFKQILDIKERDPQSRLNYPVLISRKVEAKKVLQSLSPMEQISTAELNRKMNVTERVWGQNINAQIDEIINSLVSEGRDVIVSGVEMKDDQKKIGNEQDVKQTQPKGQTKISGIGLFRNGNLVRWVEDNESRGFLFILNRIQDTVINTTCNHTNKLSVKLNKSKTKIDAEIKNDKPLIHIRIDANGAVGETQCAISLENPDTINQLRQKVALQIKKEVQQAVRIAQREKSDVFGFGEAIHRADPHIWRRWKDSWKEGKFPQVQVDIKVYCNLRNTGMRTNPLDSR